MEWPHMPWGVLLVNIDITTLNNYGAAVTSGENVPVSASASTSRKKQD